MPMPMTSAGSMPVQPKQPRDRRRGPSRGSRPGPGAPSPARAGRRRRGAGRCSSITPLAYAWTAAASSSPSRRPPRPLGPDSVPKSMPMATFTPGPRRGGVGPGTLAVVRGRAVLAVEVTSQQLRPDAGRGGSIEQRAERHRRDRLEGDRGVDGARGVIAPAERTVRRDEHRRRIRGGPARGAQRLDDHLAGLPLVLAGDLGRLEGPGHRDRAPEVVRMRRARGTGSRARPGPTRWRRGVRVDDPADLRELAVQQPMRRRVRGGPEVAVDHAPVVERRRRPCLGVELGVRDAARLDDQHARVPVDAAHVAERERHEAGPLEGDVRRGDLHLQLREGHSAASPGLRRAAGIQTRIASTVAVRPREVGDRADLDRGLAVLGVRSAGRSVPAGGPASPRSRVPNRSRARARRPRHRAAAPARRPPPRSRPAVRARARREPRTLSIRGCGPGRRGPASPVAAPPGRRRASSASRGRPRSPGGTSRRSPATSSDAASHQPGTRSDSVQAADGVSRTVTVTPPLHG